MHGPAPWDLHQRMSAVQNAPLEDRARPRRPLVSAEAARNERRFWIGLACAFLVHALILVGTLASVPKRVGEEKGARDGISVVIVDLADLESRSSVPNEPPTPPAPPAEAPRPPTPPPQPKTPPQATPKQEAAPQQQPAATPVAPQIETTLPLELPGERKPQQKQAMQPQPTPAPTPKPPAQKPAQPSFEMPDISLAPGRMQTAATRPAGITRSGENDEFGRNVIRALARVMPRLNIMGRVTVRIFLNDRGNLAEVKVLRASDDPYLDQNVVFSVKQANFPIPPDASTSLDRTFIVTYIYR